MASRKRHFSGYKLRNRLKAQRGQAMTEFVVSVAFVFLAIFVFVPTFGKIMDLQFQNMMAARYVAWERTVWFDQISDNNRDDFVISGKEWESVAMRDDSEIINSMENRFFYKHGGLLPTFIEESDVDAPAGDVSPLWTYVQSKNTMYSGTTVVDGSLNAEETPGIAYDGLEFLGSVVSTVKDPIDSLLSFVGVDNEDLFELPLMTNEKTYYTPAVETRLNIGNAHGAGVSVWDRDEATSSFTPGIESAFFQNWDGVLKTRTAILADGWNTQSIAHYQDRADDYVPSTLFDNDLFNTVIDIASWLEGGGEDSAIGRLSFGEVGVEPIPADEDGQPLAADCDDSGYCSFGD